MTSETDTRGTVLELYMKKSIPLMGFNDISKVIKDEGFLLKCVDMMNELHAMSLGLNELAGAISCLFQNEEASERGALQAVLVGMVAGLCPNERQLKIISEVTDYIEGAKAKYNSIKIRVHSRTEIDDIDLSFLENKPENYKALHRLYEHFISDSILIKKALKTDDVGLYSLLISGSSKATGYYTEPRVLASLLKNNEYRSAHKIIEAHCGTSVYTNKDIFSQSILPFSERYNPDACFINPGSMDKNILARHGQLILLSAFQEALRNDMFSSEKSNHPEDQVSAIMGVMKAMIAAGVDWYPPWIATRCEHPVAALLDLEGKSFLLAEKINGFFSDPRIRNLEKDSRKEVFVKGLASTLPAHVLISQFGNCDKKLYTLYRLTGNKDLIEKIESKDVKRKIIEQDLSI
jgi:hypothetical protein